MGRTSSSTKKKVIKVTTTGVTKFSYLQTLAVFKDVLSPEDAATRGFNTGKKRIKSSKGLKKGFIAPYLVNPILAIGKPSSSSTTVQVKSRGAKVKDHYLQPYYDRLRYAIGIREFTVSRYKFAAVSEFVSVPFLSPKEIIKITINVDEYTPPEFDQNIVWIKYYIKVEGEQTWVRVNPLNSPTRFDEAGEIIPKIINFNLPRPTTAELEGKYNYTDTPVTKVRFRAVLSRPNTAETESTTPLLKSYRLAMVPRE